NVTKDLYPAADSGLFNLKVNGATAKADAGDGGATGYVNVAVDSNPTVGEGAGTGTTLSDYASSIACTGDSDASSSNTGPLSLGDLAAGDVVDCTITNKRKPSVRVTKDLYPSADAGKFDLKVNGATEKANAVDGDSTPYVTVPIDSTPTVGEGAATGTDLADYEASIQCSGASTASSTDAGPLSVGQLGVGDKVECTITNKRKPRVNVTKDLYPASDVGKFDLKVNGDTKKADAVDGQSTGYVNVAVGSNPSVAEGAGIGTDLANYESSIVCSGDSSASSSDAGPLSVGALTAGKVVDCTITNKRKPSVKVTKSLVPTSDGGLFNLQVNGATKKANAGDTGTTGYVNVAVDSNPTVGELAGSVGSLSDYESSIACTGASTATSNNAGPLSLGQLSAGQSAQCTITNKRKPEIKVVKKLDPASDTGTFDLKIDLTNYDNGGAGFGDGGTTGFQKVGTGSHTVAEGPHGSTSLSDYNSKVVCDSSKGTNDPGTSHTFSVAYGDRVTCEITNKRKAIVTGMKFQDQNSDGSKTGDPGLTGWEIKAYEDTNNNSAADAGELKATTTTGSGGSYTLSLTPGTYVICETGQSNWVQTTPSANNRCQSVSSASAGHLVNFTSGPVQANKDFGNAKFASESTMTDSAFRLVDDLTPWRLSDFEILLNPKSPYEIVA